MNYDTSPERREVALSSPEIEELSRTAAGQLAGSPAAVRHLLARMQATLLQQEQLRQELRRQLAQSNEQMRSGPETVLAQLRSMSEEQRAELLGPYLAGREAEVEELRQDLEMEVVAARSLNARLLQNADRIAARSGPETQAALAELLRLSGLSSELRKPDGDPV